ncbi:zinc-binding dehydrogenase [Pseudomonas zhanjiangensis]|uniref:Zinc-binding dehydrogenase n=1 Tax=Pseudomonas zhanjiangensis TaxID=3239015 RepID=A0ABV3YWV7_9PSED
MNRNNRLVRFTHRPEGRPSPEIFALAMQPLPALKAGEFLGRNCYLSMDPALVGRMRGESNYAETVEPGETMHAYGLTQVIESRHPAVKVGTVLLGRCDMQEYLIASDASAFTRINLGLAEPTAYLSAVGITGATAYFGLFDLGRPKAGETLLISAGASSVGSIAAQLGKSFGLRTVAIVSSEDKAEQAKQEWGYAAAVSYRGKSIEQLSADIARACPNGVDIYFDNTSGDISEAVLDHFNDFARHIVIGRLGISHLSDTRQDVGRRDNNAILAKRIRKQGMVLLDHKPRMMSAIVQLAKRVRHGEIQLKDDVLEGIENVPKAFFRMLNGESQGKQLVRLAEIDLSADSTPRWPGRLITARWFPTAALARLLAR